MKTPKNFFKEKHLGFGSNLIKKINIQYLDTMLIKFSLNGMNKDYQTNITIQM
jgi:hypothetical protein